MKEQNKPVKTIRLNFLSKNKDSSPTITIVGGEEPELRLAADASHFMAITQSGIAMSPGAGNNIAIQGLSHNMTYAGMVQDLPFPLTLLPATPVTPFPQQLIKVPFAEMIPELKDALAMLSAFTGI